MEKLPKHKVEPYISAVEIEHLVEEVAAAINEDYANCESILLVGLLKGSCVFLCDLMRKLTLNVEVDFIIVSSYGKETKSGGKVNIVKDISQNLTGRDVLIVEDLIDSGNTLSKISDILRQRNAKSVNLCTLFNKTSRREKPVPVRYVGRPIDDEFIVGYGMDWAEHYRHLPYVGIIVREGEESYQ
mmetsp:Transcript_8064/g.9255  ORF Transcript_8064/g.9255 Transcript_8064/m.9255 type:complete len:186 (-) Transcript_8064:267-824(-)